MISCITIDENQQALRSLRRTIEQNPELNLKLETRDIHEALEYIDGEKIDLVFLDMHRPEKENYQFIDKLKESHGQFAPKIIATTGEPVGILRGYDHGISAFLVKPIHDNYFTIAIDKIKHEQKLNTPTHRGNFLFYSDVHSNKVKINFSDIIYIEGAGNYLHIFTPEKKVVLHKSLGSLMGSLPKSGFQRIHKSYIVSLEKIECIKGNAVLFTVNNTVISIPIGMSYRAHLFSTLRIQ